METIPQLKFSRKFSPPTLLGIVAILIAILLASYAATFWYFKTVEIDRAKDRMTLYQSTVSAELERFQHVPYMLARDTFVIASAEGSGRELLSKRLAETADQARLDAIYLMDMNGLTVAASNWDAELTFLGQNYGFRPYFQNAAKGERGEFFAIGATTSRPGYFIAEPVRSVAGDIIGVIAIKLDLNNLSNAWSNSGELAFVTNQDGIVVLASNPDWRYRAIEPLSGDKRNTILAARQFGTQPLTELDWHDAGEDVINLDNQTYLHVATPLVRSDWQLHYLADIARVTERTTVLVASLAAIFLLVLAIAIFQRSQRIKQALQDSQADRRALRKVNTKLEQEVDDRRKAERRLTKAQTELARTSRLAALGHLSASVTHELGQPISAMRNYITAAEMNPDRDQSDVIKRLGQIATRMESITKQLKFFANRGEQAVESVDLRRLVDGTEILFGPDFKSEDIEVSKEMPETPVLVKGNRLRLEQVLVNLVRNSLDALTDTTERKIWISISETNDTAKICIEDNGQGLLGQTDEQIFEPFHTTRASGQGMGLGLAISSAIVKEHDGTLKSRNREGGGARFVIELPISKDEVSE